MCDDSTLRECSQVLDSYRRAPCPQHDDLVLAIGGVGQKVDKLGHKVDKVAETVGGPNLNGRAGVVADIADHAGDIQRLVEATSTLKRITYEVLLSVLGTIVAVIVRNYAAM